MTLNTIKKKSGFSKFSSEKKKLTLATKTFLNPYNITMHKQHTQTIPPFHTLESRKRKKDRSFLTYYQNQLSLQLQGYKFTFTNKATTKQSTHTHNPKLKRTKSNNNEGNFKIITIITTKENR